MKKLIKIMIVLVITGATLKSQNLATVLANGNTNGGYEIKSNDGDAVLNLDNGDNLGLTNNHGGFNVNQFGTHIDHVSQVNINTQTITLNATNVLKNGVEVATAADIITPTITAGPGISVVTSGYNYTVSATTPIKNLSGNVTTTITTATVASDLTYTLEPNSIYVIRGHIRIGCNNTGGVKLGFNWPIGTVGSLGTESRLTASNTFQWSLLVTSGGFSAPVNTVNSTTGSFIIDGCIATDVTGGNLELIYSSQTAGQTSTLYQSGTYLEVIKKNP